MKKGFLKSVLASVLCASTCFGVVGCGGSNVDSSDTSTLRIAICNQGYGRAWLDDAMKLFKEQQWVKDKYGEVKFAEPYETRDVAYASNQVNLGPSNKYDLLFTGKTDFKTVSESSYFEDLTPLLEKIVPGENVKVGDKMKTDIKNSAYMIDKKELNNDSAEGKIYGMPWVDGYHGILINDTLVREKLGDKFTGYPKTTIELVEFASLLKETDVAPFVFSLGSNYWMHIVETWWAQYEGVQGYYDYFNGYYNDERSYNIGRQKGKLYALQALENIVKLSNGYCHDYVGADYIETQISFYKREAFMMPNGDWIENEMKDIIPASPAKNDKTFFIKMPIVSNIVEKLSFKNEANAEEQLRNMIIQIDENKTYEQAKEVITNLEQADYNRVKTARGVYANEDGSVAYVPNYAVSKELAKDFLLFLSTDIAIESFAKVTSGCKSPYTFDYDSLTGDDFKISAMHKSVMDFKDGTETSLRNVTTFPLVYYGGLTQCLKEYVPETPLYSGAETGESLWVKDQAELERRWASILSNTF